MMKMMRITMMTYDDDDDEDEVDGDGAEIKILWTSRKKLKKTHPPPSSPPTKFQS